MHDKKCNLYDFIQLIKVPLSYEESSEVIKAKDLEAMRNLKQSELETKFNLELEMLRERLRIKEGPIMRERFLHTIRRWYIDYHDQNGKFPEIPPSEEGGSKTILKLDTASAPPIHIEIPNPQTKKVKIIVHRVFYKRTINALKRIILNQGNPSTSTKQDSGCNTKKKA